MALNIKYPKDNILYRGLDLFFVFENVQLWSLTFIGSSFPDKYQSFFTIGKKYRCPSFLATSSSRKISQNTFCYSAHQEGLNPILWIIHLHPDFGCTHMNYVDRTNIPGEHEFLFVPYSTFEIQGNLIP